MMEIEKIEKAIEHYESLQKRYVKTHNGKMCEITELTLKILRNNQGASEIERLRVELKNMESDRDAWQKDFNALNEGGLKRISDLESELSALREKQEREKGCEYCNEERCLYDDGYNTSYLTGTEIRNHGHGKDGENVNMDYAVMFCPICGRILKESEAGK